MAATPIPPGSPLSPASPRPAAVWRLRAPASGQPDQRLLPAVRGAGPGRGRLAGSRPPRPPPLRPGAVVFVSPRQPTAAALLGRALAQLTARPPAERALIDQNTEVLRARLTGAGIPVTPEAVAAFAAGVSELAFQAEWTSGVGGAAASLLHAAAQLTAPSACPGCVADLDRALTDGDPPAGPGAHPEPRGGGAR